MVWNYIPHVTECSDGKKKKSIMLVMNIILANINLFWGELRHDKER